MTTAEALETTGAAVAFGEAVAEPAGDESRAGPVPSNPSGDPSGFVVELAQFSGPLDLLLTLLREEQIDIYDIPIARVAEQFLSRIRALRLDEAAEYLEMAARLLRIKAQMLLPHHGSDEPWEDPRAELVRRLLEYQQVREVVDVLDARAELRRNRFAHPYTPPSESTQPALPARLAVSLPALLAAVDRVLRMARGPTVHAVVPRALDVVGAVQAARALLARRAAVQWDDLVSVGAEAWQVLSVLLALLELARLGECLLRQSEPFGHIDIARAEPAIPAALESGLVPPQQGDPVDASPAAGDPVEIADGPSVLIPHFEPSSDAASAAA